MIVLLYFAVLVAAFVLLVVRPQRRQLAAHRAVVAALEVGDEVVTTSGIYGVVRGLSETTAELEIATGVVVTLARGAIAQRVLAEPEPPPEDPDESGE
jgi:preprotein translocase subunit YajC